MRGDLKCYDELKCKSIITDEYTEMTDEELSMCHDYVNPRQHMYACSSAHLIVDGKELDDYCLIFYTDGVFKWKTMDLYMINNKIKFFSKEFIEHVCNKKSS